MMRDVKAGNAYATTPGRYRVELAAVGKGTLMGELLRRYWHPVARAAEAGATPLKVRALGEDLILFRDGQGRPGLVHSRCAHRGTTLYYGKVGERGIRCCYHGWLFDVEGRCLEQPCEPDLGARFRGRVRQPWYPVVELYDLIFAYMGPPEKMPSLPRYECMELRDGEVHLAPDLRESPFRNLADPAQPCNWMQVYENVVDPFHVPVLHLSHSSNQFTESTTQMPLDSEFRATERGVEARTRRPMGDGRVLDRISEAVLPNVCVIADPFARKMDEPVSGLCWILPIDDTHTRAFLSSRVDPSTSEVNVLATGGPPSWIEMNEEERRANPGDWEAQVGQGAITLHSEEHLATSDRGIVLLRRLFEEQLRKVERAEDPINLSFDADAPPMKLSAGNWTGSPLDSGSVSIGA